MKIVPVFSSLHISIHCPGCKVPANIKKEKPPTKDFIAVCPKCKERFLVKINNRKFYRKKVSIPFYYSVHEINDTLDTKVKKGTIVDISKTGFLFEASVNKYPLKYAYEKEGTMLNCVFQLSNKEEQLRVEGKIIRIISTNSDEKVKIGVEFLNLSEYHNKLIGFFLMA